MDESGGPAWPLPALASVHLSFRPRAEANDCDLPLFLEGFPCRSDSFFSQDDPLRQCPFEQFCSGSRKVSFVTLLHSAVTPFWLTSVPFDGRQPYHRFNNYSTLRSVRAGFSLESMVNTCCPITCPRLVVTRQRHVPS